MKIGLVPTLITRLTQHAALAQEAADAAAMNEAMAYLARCKTEIHELVLLVEAGQLSQAIQRYHEAEILLGQKNPSLEGTEVYLDVQVRSKLTPYQVVLISLVAKIQSPEGQG